MRALLCALAVILVAHAVSGQRTGSLSGDPHYTTFDGVYHDFQGVGNWVLCKHAGGLFEAQAHYFKCSGEASPVTCIRDVTVSVSDGRNRAIITWGLTPSVIDHCLIKDYTATTSTSYAMTGTGTGVFPKTGVSILDGLYTVTYNTGSKQLVIASKGARVPTVSVTIGQYLFVATLPVSYQGYVNGLLGSYDGLATTEFVAPNGTDIFAQYKIKTAAGQRYNPAALYTWGALWGVSASGPNLPITMGHTVKTMKEDGTFETHFVPMDDTEPTIPTPAEQADINTLKFNDLSDVAEIQTLCRAQFPNDAEGLNNCMYDMAAAPNDKTISASNAVAAQVATSSDGTSSDTTMDRSTALAVGLTLGLVALAAIVVGLVLYVRLNRVKRAHSQALILLQERGGTAPDSGDIRLTENI